MPRYYYDCTQCGASIRIFHLVEEIAEDCTVCNFSGSLQRAITTPTFHKKKEGRDNKVGALTKKSIEENREILNKAKEEAKNKYYDET